MPKKILVIEDEKDIRELLQLYLKRDGYDVHIAKDGEIGLRKASQERYDLVLLDLMLQLRKDPGAQQTCQKIEETKNRGRGDCKRVDKAPLTTVTLP